LLFNGINGGEDLSLKMKKMKKTLILVVLLVVSTVVNAQWTQIGSDIDGEATDDFFGVSVSLSSDGNTVAIGAPNNDGNGTDAGHVRIYENISGTWIQIGQDIDGEVADDQSGSISLSSDGSVVAIGAPDNDGNSTDAGHVRIYENISGTWTQIGQDIDGEAADDRSGNSVSLSFDGAVVAIGAPYNDGNGSDAGHVRIYENISGTWTQIGNDIEGEAAGDQSGISVSLSSNGSVVAIGAPDNDGNGSDAGHVRIYENISGTWTQIGNDIEGETADNQSGSVSLSSDGSVVAIGAFRNDGNGTDAGHVRVYENISGTWTQIGQDIDGETAGDYSGFSVSLSSDGSVVAIGAIYNSGNGTLSGHVRIYQNQSGSWTQIGSDIDGEAAGDMSGISVSISSDGSVVAIGAPANNGTNGSSSGHVRVYTNPSIGINELDKTILVDVYPNPTTGKITIECEKMQRVEVLDITGKQVYALDLSSDMLDIDISDFSKGVYFLSVRSKDGVAVQRIVLE
jgi:Flp pilus assembly pilin Flp